MVPFAAEGRVWMAVFVLVHGAWGGAHGFRKLRGPLREAGHEVFTPSLTGIGERAHLTSQQPARRARRAAARAGLSRWLAAAAAAST